MADYRILAFRYNLSAARNEIIAESSIRRRLFYILIAWIFIVFYFVLIGYALLGVFGQHEIPVVNIFYQALVGFLGGSMVIVIFLGKRSFLVQCVLSVLFTITLLISTEQVGGFVEGYVPRNIFPSPIIALEYLVLPFILMLFLDFYSSDRSKSFSRRKWMLLICAVVAGLIAIAVIPYIFWS